jgi:hypothetical protein
MFPLSQQVMVFSFNFTIFRLVLLFLWIRLIIQGEISSLRLNRIDKIFLGWVAANVVIYCILRHNSDAFVNRLGFAYNSCGIYFLFRVVITSVDDIKVSIKYIAITIILLLPILLFERSSEINIFTLLGAPSFDANIREGKIRCQGPFSHPILAGSYAAGVFPLLMILSFMSPSRKLMRIIWTGAVSSCILLTNSTGPFMALAASFGALAFWRFQLKLKKSLWILLGFAVALQFFMKAPIWFLFARLGAITGGTGYHRAALIDVFIKNFREWVLFGTRNTAHWLPYQLLPGDASSTDITNQYIRQGVDGGLMTLVLFVLLIHNCFRAVGRIERMEGEFDNEKKYLAWCLGASLLTHATSFWSVSYFDQTIVAFFFTVACINSFDQWRESLWSQEKPDNNPIDNEGRKKVAIKRILEAASDR